MNPILSEIREIPDKARALLSQPTVLLPLHVPYLGMGSSYFAPLAFKYMGVDIHPELASEYYNYLSTGEKHPLAVILSQSGRSSEALWCTDLFEAYVAVTNYPDNPLGTRPNVRATLDIGAGDEQFSSSKTYVNTLLALFRGFGFDPTSSVDLLIRNFSDYEQQGKALAEAVYALRQTRPIHGIYITGSGPNIATAYEAALILSESTKLAFVGLPMAQYDHGPKETARDSIVINIQANGPNRERTKKLAETIRAAGATVLTVEEPEADRTGGPEQFLVLHNIVPFNFMAYYLAEKMGVGDTFTVGGKVTEVL